MNKQRLREKEKRDIGRHEIYYRTKRITKTKPRLSNKNNSERRTNEKDGKRKRKRKMHPL